MIPKYKQDQYFQNVFDRAYDAGWAAGAEALPTPVQWRDSKTGKFYEPCHEGICGAAGVKFNDKNVSPPGKRRKYVRDEFGEWLRSQGLALRVDGDRFTRYAVHDFNQSYDRKVAFAKAFADALKTLGYNCSVYDRID